MIAILLQSLKFYMSVLFEKKFKKNWELKISQTKNEETELVAGEYNIQC